MGKFLGIDLGTTFSAMATIDDTGRPVIVHNQEEFNGTLFFACHLMLVSRQIHVL